MSKNLTVRAWKDASFRASLSDAQRAQIQRNPAGECDLDPTRQTEGGHLPMATRIDTLGGHACCG